MQLSQLQQLLSVYQTMNITKAAEQLHMTQPALSRSIRQLEEELGFALFEREGGKRITRATAAGEVFLRGADQALDALAQAEAQGRAVNDRTQQRRFSIVSTLGELGAPAIDWMVDRHPRAAMYNYDLADPEELQGLMQNKCLDVAITTEKRAFAGTEFLPLYDERYVLAAAADDSRPLWDSRLMCFSFDLEETVAEQLVRTKGVRMQLSFRCADREIVLHQVLSGKGKAIIPLSRGHAWLENGAVLCHLPADAEQYTQRVGLAVNLQSLSDPLTNIFIELCQAYFRDLQARTDALWAELTPCP